MIEALISAAVALILAAQQPNVPADLRAQAFQVANVALEYASKQNTQPVTVYAAPVVNPTVNRISELRTQIERVNIEIQDLSAEWTKAWDEYKKAYPYYEPATQLRDYNAGMQTKHDALIKQRDALQTELNGLLHTI